MICVVPAAELREDAGFLNKYLYVIGGIFGLLTFQPIARRYVLRKHTQQQKELGSSIVVCGLVIL